ncbi:hypothetical protein DL546_000670 [Coniochaeta pulveracea]|uniref:Heterokaryon incompatibility domain-containing protein n=1 Tax=Coniochaeta pulveracea TaxID=177199 RepID=A0A420XWJ4_9PEZI|nr:hypothetical protein DL546_000670 [Coniochaeta pulveracea]
MRLLNAQTYVVEEFIGSSIPPYAILSHTWGPGEASFARWRGRWSLLCKAQQPGFRKIKAAMRQTKQDGLQYVWVDTICIDKSSSAELTEAINSMFGWYRDAAICYVYLADVPHVEGDQKVGSAFGSSRWFTRGWTLQELVAPSNVVFYSKQWTSIGTKSSLSRRISNITGIDERCIRNQEPLDEYSVAQRMSWACHRTTTREEDMAYCLMGIFDLNMPLLYGEGRKAFRRLQEEIVRRHNDHTVLSHLTTPEQLCKDALFAEHPGEFQNDVALRPNKHTSPFHLTNAGLSVTMPVIHCDAYRETGYCLALLDCFVLDDKYRQRNLVFLPLSDTQLAMRFDFPSSLLQVVVEPDSGGPGDGRFRRFTRTATPINLRKTCISLRLRPELEGDVLTNDSPVLDVGFMLTFPRNLCGYALKAAWPANSQWPPKPSILPTFFVPTRQTSGIADGIILFQQYYPRTHQFDNEVAAVYVATDHDPQEPPVESLRWCCTVVHLESERIDQPGLDEELARIAATERQKLLMPGVTSWSHFHELGNVAVAARMWFKNDWKPCRRVIMLEVVFDSPQMMEEMYHLGDSDGVMDDCFGVREWRQRIREFPHGVKEISASAEEEEETPSTASS